VVIQPQGFGTFTPSCHFTLTWAVPRLHRLFCWDVSYYYLNVSRPL